MDPAMIHLADHIRNPRAIPFEATRLANTVHLSISQMNRRFRRTWGVSPKEFWMRHRLAKAQEHLRESNEKIQSIAGLLGFCDAYYFSKWFTQHTGMSPRRFRTECGRARM